MRTKRSISHLQKSIFKIQDYFICHMQLYKYSSSEMKFWLFWLCNLQNPIIWSVSMRRISGRLPSTPSINFYHSFIKNNHSIASSFEVPDPEWQFVVEGDASDTGEETVLSVTRISIHVPTSLCISPQLRNYDTANRKLLAFTLALEE